MNLTLAGGGKPRNKWHPLCPKVPFGHYIMGMFNLDISIINEKMAELPQCLGNQ